MCSEGLKVLFVESTRSVQRRRHTSDTKIEDSKVEAVTVPVRRLRRLKRLSPAEVPEACKNALKACDPHADGTAIIKESKTENPVAEASGMEPWAVQALRV